MKHIIKIIGIGFGVGILLVILANVFSALLGIPMIKFEEGFGKYYLIVGLVIILTLIVIKTIYIVYYINKIKKVAPYLGNGDAERFTIEIEKLLNRAKGANLRNLIMLDLSTGYFYQKKYEKAIEVLENMDEDRLNRQLLEFYKINSCITYFYAGRNEKARFLYKENYDFFKKYETKGKGDFLISCLLTHVLSDIEEKKYDAARDKIEKIKRAHSLSPLMEANIIELEEKISASN